MRSLKGPRRGLEEFVEKYLYAGLEARKSSDFCAMERRAVGETAFIQVDGA